MVLHPPCRRLELFGEEHNIRDGWVTVGLNLPASNFRPDVYANHFRVGQSQAANYSDLKL
jgi:N6-adenosine-specific RNA methylase IME4